MKFTYLTSFAILLLFAISACKTKKHINSSNADVYVTDSNYENTETVSNESDDNNTIVENSTIDKDDYQENEIDTIATDTLLENSETIIKKDLYKVAIVLPFMEDTVRNNWKASASKNYTNFQTPQKSENAISFYEGFVMGLKDLKLNSKFNISVFDTENSLQKTTDISNNIADENFDIVICPFSSKNINELTKVEKDNNTIFISPFSPSTAANSGANKFYMLEPPINKHIETMIKYGIETSTSPKITLFYQDNPFGQKSATFFTNYIDTLNKNKALSEQITYAIVDISNKNIYRVKLADHIDIIKDNLFIINSFDENTLSILLQKINSLNKKENRLTIFGMPGWEHSEILRVSYLNNNNLHFTESTWDNEDEDTQLFKEQYKSTYKKQPNNEVYLGYDVAQIFINIVDKHGLNFDSELLKADYKSFIKDYKFSKNPNGRIENNSLHIYKIENFDRILVK